jgi:hypothetical protein
LVQINIPDWPGKSVAHRIAGQGKGNEKLAANHPLAT